MESKRHRLYVGIPPTTVDRMLTRHQLVQLAHILILGPLLIGIGLEYVPPSKLIVGLGITVLLYHIFRMSQRGLNWINAFHALAVAPVLIFYGQTGDSQARDLSLALGIAAVGYHAFRLFSSA